MSYELKTNTAIRLAVGPLVDPTDGKTAETSLTVTALSVQIYQIKTDGTAVVRTQFAPTASGGTNDMVLVVSSTDGMYDLEITAAQLNWLGNGRISFYDVDGFLVHYFDIHVVSANYFNNKYGSTVEDVNIASEDNIDFGALKKTSLNAATPASTGTVTGNVDGSVASVVGAVGSVTGAVGSVTGHTNQTGDSYAIVNNVTHGNAALKALIDTIDGVVDTILIDTNELQTNQGNWATATGFSTHNAAAVKTAIEAAGSDLDRLMIALVNKMVTTKASGNVAQYNDANGLIGTINSAITSDATTVTRLRMVQ